MTFLAEKCLIFHMEVRSTHHIMKKDFFNLNWNLSDYEITGINPFFSSVLYHYYLFVMQINWNTIR